MLSSSRTSVKETYNWLHASVLFLDLLKVVEVLGDLYQLLLDIGIIAPHLTQLLLQLLGPASQLQDQALGLCEILLLKVTNTITQL